MRGRKQEGWKCRGVKKERVREKERRKDEELRRGTQTAADKETMADKGGNTGRACAVCVGQRQQCLIGPRRAEQCRALPLHNNRPSCLTPRPLSPAIRVTPRRRPVRHPITPDSASPPPPLPHSSNPHSMTFLPPPSRLRQLTDSGCFSSSVADVMRGALFLYLDLKKKKLQMELY